MNDIFPAEKNILAILVCDGTDKTRAKLKEVIDQITLPDESVEIRITCKLLNKLSNRS